MGTTVVRSKISACLFPKARQILLALFLADPHRRYYVTDIVRRSRVGTGAVQRELVRLADAGILQRTMEGPLVYYQANLSCPVYAELRTLVAKTSGVAEAIATDLAALKPQIRAAVIYGSVARGEERNSSDIDLLVIGRVSLQQVCSALLKTQERLGREINPTIFPLAEFRRKLAARDAFLTRVVSGARIPVIGGIDDAGRVVE